LPVSILLFLASRALAGCSTAATSAVVINEIHADPPGADAGLEWLELVVRPDGTSADLTGWAILAGTSSLTSSAGFPPTVLEPGELLVVGAGGLAVDLPSLGNAGSGSADAVLLVDCQGDVADTVIYGTPNSDGFLDDAGEIATSLAPAAPSGASTGRVPDALDTDESGLDFAVIDPPTPGTPNAPAPPPCHVGGRVTINEVLVNPEGADTLYEFVELHNASTVEADLAGWQIVAVTRSDREVVTDLDAPLALEPGGFLLVGGDAVPHADVHGDLDLGNGDGTDGVRLVDCEGAIRDTVVYGEAHHADGILDDAGFLAEPYGAPSTDELLARRRDGLDRDAAEDWVVRGWASPGASNEVEVAESIAGGCHGPPEIRPAPRPRDPAGGCGTPGLPAAPGALVGLAWLGLRRSTSRSSADR